MRISVIVPTYRRVRDLQRCLEALAAQQRPAEQVVVSVRESDAETLAFLEQTPMASRLGLLVARVSEPGVVAAMNAALEHASGDVIALTDDDAAPWPDWLARIEAAFHADPRLGAIGGRDWQYKQGRLDDGVAARPGEMNVWGRISAGHHWATPGPPREVAVVKGVNSAYRAAPLRQMGFDRRLAGTGAQVHWEVSLCLALIRQGWKIVFDPAIAVDHFPAIRFDEDQRNQINPIAQRNAVANETLVLLEHLRGVQRVGFCLWSLAVGTRGSPGLLQIPRLLAMRQPRVSALWWATCRGRSAGLAMYLAHHKNVSRLPSKRPSTASLAAGEKAS